jgi:hypothetical protein
MRNDVVARLANQLAESLRGRDPGDPKTRAGLEGTMARMRHAADRLAEMPAPFPGVPATAALSDEEADAIIAAVLARLAEGQ